MQVTLLSTNERAGGAAIAANRLHLGLQRGGVASRMVVLGRQSDDPAVDVVGRGPGRRLRRFVRRRRRRAFRRRYGPARPPKLELFSDDRVPWPDALAGTLPAADVYNPHWVAGFLDYGRFFRRLPAGTPFVWTLHDMNPFTGGCHYDLGCGRFRDGCGACPQLGSRDPADLSAQVHHRKAAALAHLRPATTRIVAPSAWLAREAADSALFARFRVDIIPNGLDTDVFRPQPRACARDELGLPAGGRVVLFGADSVANHRKGFDLLLEALDGLGAEREVTLAALGGGTVQVPAAAGPVVPLGRIGDARLLALAYAAADLFVLPTRADNLPNVVLEAMACGTPVVGFDVGGVPDMVRPGETGLLAPPEDVDALRGAIATLLDDDDLRARLGAECRRVAVEAYRLELQAERYKALYEELLEARDRAAGND